MAEANANKGLNQDMLLSNGGCNTAQQWTSHQFTWVITNFSEHRGDALKSAIFATDSNERVKWRIRLQYNGASDDSNEELSLFVILMSSDQPALTAKFKFSIIDNQCNETRTWESPVCNFVPGKLWGVENFMKKEFLFDQANGILQNDNLTINCELSVLTGGNANNLGAPLPGILDLTSTKSFNNFADLFDNERFSDVTIVLGNHKLKAHKAILAANCAVFALMFQMENPNVSHVTITHLDFDVFKAMLRFIYTGESPEIATTPEALLMAAHMYGVPKLKASCESWLVNALTIDNAAETLILSDTYKADYLAARTIDYLNANVLPVMATDGWRKMVMTRPELLVHIFIQAYVFPNKCLHI